MNQHESTRIIVRNRKARFDYEIKTVYEAGIELRGSEVKSLREGKVTISDAYALIEKGEVWLKNLHINPYKMASDNHDPLRPRRLLLHAKEIAKLRILVEQKGQTLIPLSLYFKGQRVKIELAVAVGRKKYDKRQAIAKEDARKKISKALKRDI